MTSVALSDPVEEPACVASEATEMSWAQLFWRQDEFEGKCVTLDGYTGSRELFENVAGYYRYHQPAFTHRYNRGWIGVYAPEEREGNDSNLAKARVVGRLKNCGRESDRFLREIDEENERAKNQDTESITIGFIGGYCHYRSDYALFDATVVPGNRSDWTRARGEVARADFGDLFRAEGGLQPSEQIRAQIAQFEAAARSSNRAWLKENLNDWGASTPDEEKLVADVLGGLAVSFANEDGSSRAIYFRARTGEAWDHAPNWYACYCKGKDCTGEWPIAGIDAALDDRHPYVCISIQQNYDDETRWDLELPVLSYLPE